MQRKYRSNQPQYSRDSSLGTVTRLRAGMSGLQNSVGARDFSLLSTTPRLSVEYDVNRPRASSTEGKNEWSYISAPPIRLHEVQTLPCLPVE